MIDLKSRPSLFWILQTSGWVLYLGLILITYWARGNLTAEVFKGYASSIAISFLVTLSLRLLYRKIEIQDHSVFFAPEGDRVAIVGRAIDQIRSPVLEGLFEKLEGLVHLTKPRMDERQPAPATNKLRQQFYAAAKVLEAWVGTERFEGGFDQEVQQAAVMFLQCSS